MALNNATSTVGEEIQIQIQLVDASNNVIPIASRVQIQGVTDIGTSYFAATEQTLANGRKTLVFQDTSAVRVTFLLTDTAATGYSVSSTLAIQWIAGPTTRYVVTTIPSTAVVGTPISFSAQAFDQYGNSNNNEQRDLTVSVNGSAVGSTFPITNGRGSASINDTVAESNVQVQISGPVGVVIANSVQYISFTFGKLSLCELSCVFI